MLKTLSSISAFCIFVFLAQFCASVNADITTSQSIMAAYWGQDDQVRQKDLVDYCKDDVLDIIMVSFLMNFGGTQLTLNLADNGTPCKASSDPNSMFICDYMTSQIKTCQEKGKVIMLSLGGDSGNYNINTAAEGVKLADTLWNKFGGGKDPQRPFGDAILDGFDLDIEHGETEGYSAFIKQLRSYYAKDTSKTYYISGAPQCQFPDRWLGKALDSSWFDFVFVQFYNNEECDLLHPKVFNFNQWDSWSQKTSPNKNVRVLLGLPAAKNAAGSGYATSTLISTETQKLREKYKSFGGVMLWDASHGYANTQDGSPNFITAVAKSIHQGKSGENSAPKPSKSKSAKPTKGTQKSSKTGGSSKTESSFANKHTPTNKSSSKSGSSSKTITKTFITHNSHKTETTSKSSHSGKSTKSSKAHKEKPTKDSKKHKEKSTKSSIAHKEKSTKISKTHKEKSSTSGATKSGELKPSKTGENSVPTSTGKGGASQCSSTDTLKCDKDLLMQCSQGYWITLVDCSKLGTGLGCDQSILNCAFKSNGATMASRQFWARLASKYSVSPRIRSMASVTDKDYILNESKTTKGTTASYRYDAVASS